MQKFMKQLKMWRLTVFTEALITFSIIGAFLVFLRKGYNDGLNKYNTLQPNQLQIVGNQPGSLKPFDVAYPLLNGLLNAYVDILIALWIFVIIAFILVWIKISKNE